MSANMGNSARNSTDMMMPWALSRVAVLSPPVCEEALVPELPLAVESDPELASGFDTPLVALAVCDTVADAVADGPVSVAVCDAPESEADADSDGSAACATNGFELLPPVPEVRSRENVVSSLCC